MRLKKREQLIPTRVTRGNFMELLIVTYREGGPSKFWLVYILSQSPKDSHFANKDGEAQKD